MKVIREKKAMEDWSMQVTCNGKNWRQKVAPCGSILEIEVGDLFERGWSKYPDYEGVNYGYVCPICGCFSELNDSDVTNDMKVVAKKWSSRFE